MRIIFFSSIGSFFRRFFATCQDYWYVPPKAPVAEPPQAPAKPVKKASNKRPLKTGSRVKKPTNSRAK